MPLTHDPYLLQTHSQARIDTALAKPNGVACTSSLMPLPERMHALHKPASVQQHHHPSKARRTDKAGQLLGMAGSATVLMVALAGFALSMWRLM